MDDIAAEAIARLRARRGERVAEYFARALRHGWLKVERGADGEIHWSSTEHGRTVVAAAKRARSVRRQDGEPPQ